MARFDGKVALVTGGGSGIGEAVSKRLAREGAQVVVTDIAIDAAQRVVDEIVAAGGTATAVQQDVASAEDAERVVRTAVETYGGLHLAVNNAGIGGAPARTADIAPEAWQKVVDVNLTGVFLCTQQAFKHMKQQSPMGGRIINNGSISADRPRPLSIAYTATKHAVTGLTKSSILDGRKVCRVSSSSVVAMRVLNLHELISPATVQHLLRPN